MSGNIKVEYKDYVSMIIEQIKLPIDDEKCQTFKIIEKEVEVNGENVLKKFVEYKVIDEQMMYEMTYEMDKCELQSLIKALRSLLQQIDGANISSCK